MTFENPVIRGYYPDPSVCRAHGKYFLVASSNHYFPGVPLFESDDLINWRQIGFCLTRESQSMLDNSSGAGGIFAPTIRYHDGRFYLVTTNVDAGGNFYVWTDDIYGEWSPPVFIDQDGIDPSLYFEDGIAYFMSNGVDENGRNAIFQCTIDMQTGRRLSERRLLWHGTGGRYLEGPHLYKIRGQYYLLAAEGGTEYGHMVVYARGDTPWGPFTPYAANPVLTNRNLGGYQLQGIGHGDLIEDANGHWWMYTLGFRQIHRWLPYHHLGREVCLVPVTFDADGWFTAGDGTASVAVETGRIDPDVTQCFQTTYTFENTRWDRDWQFVRSRKTENYIFEKDRLKIKSTGDTGTGFIALHQKEFDMDLSVRIKVLRGEAGITVYMDEQHHYDWAVMRDGDSCRIALTLTIGDIRHEQASVTGAGDEVRLNIRSNALSYTFSYYDGDTAIALASAQSKYLSSEVAGGFTGVMLGLYCRGGEQSVYNEFCAYECRYEKPALVK